MTVNSSAADGGAVSGRAVLAGKAPPGAATAMVAIATAGPVAARLPLVTGCSVRRAPA